MVECLPSICGTRVPPQHLTCQYMFSTDKIPTRSFDTSWSEENPEYKAELVHCNCSSTKAKLSAIWPLCRRPPWCSQAENSTLRHEELYLCPSKCPHNDQGSMGGGSHDACQIPRDVQHFKISQKYLKLPG